MFNDYAKPHRICRRGGRHNFGIMFGMSKGWSENRPVGRVCQFISGLPTADDGCKCGAPAIEGKPYCRQHFDRCYAQTVQPEKGNTDDVPREGVPARRV